MTPRTPCTGHINRVECRSPLSVEWFPDANDDLSLHLSRAFGMDRRDIILRMHCSEGHHSDKGMDELAALGLGTIDADIAP